jgi:rubrerythrin
MKERFGLPRQYWSRRKVLSSGAIAGALGALSLPLVTDRVLATPTSKARQKSDLKVLNSQLYFEHQAIWAYGFAAGKLTNTEVGKAVLAVALANQADHKKHRDLLISQVQSLGGVPVKAEASYDVSSYIQKREGNLESDVNIAKLALALETDAAIAYTSEVAKLKTPEFVMSGASIGSNEAAHATAIRAAFNALGVKIAIVPAAFVSAENRDAWVLKV